ncbi:cytochrome b6-f complex iron-sulfur subunit [Abditibacteriota bacterium]|nr:cytochrome b6-f complex iron-sulfur subunit [Abditibacteriota bacterium]
MNSEKEVSRRQLLSGVGALGGALILSRVALAEEGKDTDGKATQITDGQVVLRLNDNPELGKVGGWKIFDVGQDRVIVANTDKGLVACSAICTHRGCDVEYRADSHQFVCPCHGARYDEDGKVVRAPARKDLQKYASDSAIIVSKT